MAETYRDLLILICLCLLGWGLIRIERIYQYPFFMGSMFVSFLLPQAFSLIDNPSAAVNQEALERVLLVSCLCATACWIGYQAKPNLNWLAKLNIAINERKLFKAGIFLIAEGWFFNFLLSRTTIATGSNGNWSGPATIYLFLSQAINIAFGIFLLLSLKRSNSTNLICTVISGWPLLSSVLGGRRQPTMTFIIFIGFSLWLIRRYIPPRWAVIAAAVIMTFLIPLFGELRGVFWNLVFSGNWQEILSTAQKAFNAQQAGNILELRNAALLMDAAENTGIYGYGTGFWDSIIFQYVPGQIVGYGFKESLQFKWLTPDTLVNLYGYYIPNGSTYTGVGDSFMEFSYLGCLTFGLIGYMFKHLWISAVYQKSIISKVLYMGLVSPAMVGLTHGIGRFLQEAIFQVIFVTLVACYSKATHCSYSVSPEVKDFR